MGVSTYFQEGLVSLLFICLRTSNFIVSSLTSLLCFILGFRDAHKGCMSKNSGSIKECRSTFDEIMSQSKQVNSGKANTIFDHLLI